MNIAQAVSERVRQLLEERDNMPQHELAKKMGVFPQSLNQMLNTKNKSVNLRTVFLICMALDITIIKFVDSPLFLNVEIE